MALRAMEYSFKLIRSIIFDNSVFMIYAYTNNEFTKKIKLDYNIKLFNEHITNKNFDQAYQLIVNLKKK